MIDKKTPQINNCTIAPQLDLPANNDIYQSRRERIINAAYTVKKNR